MTALRFALRLVHIAARLVPRWQRRDWQREWNAELRHHALEQPPPLSLVHRSTGGVADAAYIRSHALQLDLLFRDVRFAWRNAVRRRTSHGFS